MSKAHWLLIDPAKGLADKPVHGIAPKDVLAVLRPIEAKGNYETARRLRSTIGRVLRFAVANGWAERDATADLRGALTAPNVRHRAAIVKLEPLGTLMRAVYSWESGQPTTTAALKLMALLGLRPGEVRAAHWDEIDFEKRTWTVPLGRVKMRRVHATPLPDQAIGSAVRRAYARGQYWDERVAMMQWWADYLDQLWEGAKIIPFEDKRRTKRR